MGAKKLKRHLLAASTSLYTYYLLGDRGLATFKAFLLCELTGVIVHDRYVNYDSQQITAPARTRPALAGAPTLRRPPPS